MVTKDFVGVYKELISGCASDINKISKEARLLHSSRRNRRLLLRVAVLKSIINELKSEVQEAV